MKKNTILMIMLVAGLLACKDDEEPSASTPEFGKATLVLNNKSSEFTALAGSWRCNPTNLTLSLSNLSTDLTKGVSFFIGNIPAKEGRYTLRRRGVDISSDNDNDCKLDTSFGSALAYGGETLVVFYEILEDEAPNELVITRYDPVAQQLEGHLQITLAVGEKLFPIGNLEHPDTLRVTQSTFVANIEPPKE
ncbi:hypothetical protein [Tunicatimonas pelagia]|uniref:hypothetical protein n=1 Tax=Tunicatimonas pelagia TaxID=931531 RepID=UPI002665DAC3|nr:hypothetical protein [Tunicatimonas pelagia]WKN40562.1 hypothetical protein P0M28_16100 [Tunicatimonas pelagia]